MKTLQSLLILAVVCALPRSAFTTLHEVREVHYQMGTFLEMTLWHREPDVAKHLIRASIQEVHRLEEILSNFDPDSSVSRFNQEAGNGKITLPPELYDILKIARQFSIATMGYFDVTVGPLVELWKDCLSLGHFADRSTLVRTLSKVGYKKLKLYKSGEAELLLPGMKIDLGGIGKGYAVDRVVGRLKAAGMSSALINFGGSSFYAMGNPPNETAWKIGIQGTDGRMRGVVYLRDLALSTSGTMGISWTVDGKQFGHLIDPKTGMPVSESRMATVIAPTATAAEGLTKPLGLIGANALSMLEGFAQAQAVVIPESGPLFFSKAFRSKSWWREAHRQ